MRRRILLPLIVVAVSPTTAAHCSRSSSHVASGDEGVDRVGDAMATGDSLDLPAPLEAGPPPSPFHVFVTARPESDESSPDLHLCPLRGATWLCGNQEILVVRNGTVEREPAFEMGLPRQDDAVDGGVEVVGHWPDNAWLVLFRYGVPEPNTFVIYRWQGDRWRGTVPAFSNSNMEMSVVPWGSGGALIVHRVGLGQIPLRGIGTRKGSYPRLAAMPGCKGWEHLGPVVAFDDGSITASIHDICADEELIERWASPFSVPRVHRLPLRPGATTVGLNGMSGDTPDDLTVWGGEDHRTSPSVVEEKAYLAHYDGQAWTVLGVPPGVTTVHTWVRDAKGAAWITTQDASYHRALWEEISPGAWTSVVPPGACEPWKVSKASDESLWVECWHDAELALLSTATPTRVVEFGPPKRRFVLPPGYDRRFLAPLGDSE